MFLYFQHSSPHLEKSLNASIITLTKDLPAYAIANIGFKEGIHAWEFYTPFSTEGLKFGIVKEGSTIDAPIGHFFEFKTTTPRLCRVELNQNDHTLKFYLNGQLNTNKGVGKGLSVNELLEDCLWYPSVQITQLGNQVILHPEIYDLTQYQFYDSYHKYHQLPIPQYTNANIEQEQLCIKDDEIILSLNCAQQYQRLRIDQYTFLYSYAPWQYAQLDATFIQQFTQILNDYKFVYLNISHDQPLIQMIQYLQQNITKLEERFAQPIPIKQKIKEDPLLDAIQQVFDQKQSQEIINQEEQQQEKFTISIQKSKMLINIIIQILDQMNKPYGLLSPINRLITFTNYPSLWNPLEAAEHSYLLPRYSPILKESTNISPIIIRSSLPLDGHKPIKCHSNRYIGLQKNNYILILNKEIQLFQAGQFDLCQIGPFQKKKKLIVQNVQDTPSQIYKILENYLTVETEPLNLYDQKLLGQLIAMGFEEKAAKEALIQSNNVLLNAVDILSLQPKTWTCPACTLINSETSQVCEACETARDELQIMNTDNIENKAVNLNNVIVQPKEIEENEEQSISPEIVPLLTNNISHVLQIHLENNLTPLLYISVHSEKVISIKKLSHNPEYLSQFFVTSDQHKCYCKLTNQWTQEIDYSTILNSETSTQIVETLAPLYGKNIQKNYQFQPIDHKAFILPHKILDLEYIIVNQQLYLFILTQKQLIVYEIILDSMRIVLYKNYQMEDQSNLLVNKNLIFIYGSYTNSYIIQDFNLTEYYPITKVQIVDGQYCDENQIPLILQKQEIINEANFFQQVQDSINDEEVLLTDIYFDEWHSQNITIPNGIITILVKATFESSTVPQYSLPHAQILQHSYNIQNPIKLPLTVQSFTGSSFNNATFVTSMLYETPKPFTSNYPKAQFVFRHQHCSNMLVDHVIVKNEITNVQRGFPVGSGLIFTAQSESGLQGNHVFEGMEMEEYGNWREFRQNIPLEYQEWEPVGCFEFIGDELEVVCKLDIVRPCQVIMLKPTNFRKSPYDQTQHFEQNSLEIKEFQAFGKETTESYKIQKYTQKSGVLFQELKKRLRNFDLKENQVYECLVNSRRIARYTHRQPRELDLPNNGELEFEMLVTNETLVTNEMLVTNEIETKLNPGKSDWQLLHLQIYGKRCKSELHLSLRNKLFNENQYSELNSKLVEQLYSVDGAQRLQAMKILNISMKNQKIAQLVLKDLNLQKFIIMNVLQSELSQPIADFLKFIPFDDNFIGVAKQIFQKINKLIITESGLETFIGLLKYGKENVGSMCFDIYKQCVKQLIALGDHKYFDQYIFSTKYGLIENANQQLPDEYTQENTQLETQLKPLYCKQDPLSQIVILEHSQKYQIHVFHINLLGLFQLSKLQLRFQNTQNILTFRVQVWNQQQLLLDQEFIDSIFVQFTQYTRNCLHIPLNVCARQLKVQITLGSPTLFAKASQSQQIPQNSLVIFPEFYGTLLDPIPDKFEVQEEFKYNTTILYGDTLYYSYLSKTKQLLDSYNVFQKINLTDHYIVVSNNQLVRKKASYLESAILQLQTELQLKEKNGLPINHLKQLIESTQVELLRVSPPKNYENNQNFLTTLACNLLTLLQDISYKSDVDDELIMDLLKLGDRGILSNISLKYLATHYKLDALMIPKLVENWGPYPQKVLNSIQLPLKESLQYLLKADKATQEFFLEIIIHHLKLREEFDVTQVPREENKEILELALQFLVNDEQFRLDLVSIALQKCSATQIKDCLNEDWLQKMTKNGFRHPKNFRKLLDGIFEIRILANKYLDWSALQFLEEKQRNLVEEEKESLRYVSKFVLYFYQQLIQQSIESMEIEKLLVLFDFLSRSIMKLNKTNRQMEKKQRKKIENATEFEDFLHRQHLQICSTQTVNKLIQQIKNQDDYSTWNKVLKVIFMMHPQQINEEQLYSQIIQVYRNNLLFNEILQFTLNLCTLEIQQSATCSQIVLALLGNTQLEEILIIVSEKLISTKIIQINRVFEHLANYLQHHNVGGKEGCQVASVELIKTLEYICALLRIILQSEQVCPQLDQIDEMALNKIIVWYTYNASIVAIGSPSLFLLLTITTQLDQLFDILQCKTLILKLFFRTQFIIDNTILPQIANDQITNFNSFNQSIQITDNVITMFDKYLLTDSIAKEVAIQSDAFNYLIQKIISKRQKQQFEKQLNFADLKEEEFGSKLKIVNLPGQNIAQIQDWSLNKKGVKTRIALLNLPTTMRSEYQLLFILDHEIELKSLKIGFQTYTTDFTDKILGTPSSILLEVGLQQDELYPLQELDFINDEHYTQYQVKVFSYNACKFQNTPNCNTVKYISLRIRAPILQMVDGISSWAIRTCKKICFGISFCSVLGYPVIKGDNQAPIHMLQEKTALELMCKLCKPQFDQTLQSLANNQNILQKIQDSFPKFMKALICYSDKLTPLIMAIAKYNQDAGDWIAQQLMNTQSEMPHARLLTQITLSNSQVHERLLKLHQYLIPKLLALSPSSQNQSQEIVQFVQLAPFIETYCTVLLLSSKNSRLKQREVIIPITKDDIIHLISLKELVKQHSTYHLLIKLIVNLTYLPHPYIQISEVEQIMMFTWNMAEMHPYFLDILASLALGSNESIKWITKQLPNIVGKLLKLLENYDKNNNETMLKSSILFLNTISYNKECADLMLGNLSNIYDSLIENDQSNQILKPLEDSIVQQFTRFIAHMLQTYQAKFIVESLIRDIKKLQKVNDMRFVQLVLVPILNCEHYLQVSLNFLDIDQYISDPRQIAAKITTGDLSNIIMEQEHDTFESSLLTADQSNQMLKQLQIKNWQRVAFQKNDGDSSILPILEDKFLNETPNLMILQYKRNAEEGIFGIVNYGEGQKKNKFSTDKIYDYNGHEKTVLFTYLKNGIKCFLPNYDFNGNLDIYDNQGTFVFQIGGKTFLMIEYVEGESSHLSLEFMGEKQDSYLLDSLKIEYWIPKKEGNIIKHLTSNSVTLPILQTLGYNSSQSTISTIGYGDLNNLLFPEQFYDTTAVINYYSITPIYYLPSHLKLNQLKSMLNMNKYLLKEDSKILDNEEQLNKLSKNQMNVIEIDINAKQFLEDINLQTKLTKTTYPQQMAVFPIFEQLDGVKVIIEVIRNAVTLWKNEVKAKAWLQFIDELWSFCHLPNFFNLFMKNQLCVTLLFDLLAGIPDTNDQIKSKKWEEEEANAVKFIYSTLVNVFTSQNTAEVRTKALERNLIQHILDRIAQVSKENKRTFQIENIQIDEKSTSIVLSKQDSLKKKTPNKRGIGYASDNTGQNQKWNTAEYVEKKNLKSQQLISLLGIVESFFDFTHWHPSEQLLEKLKTTLFESALLPLLESGFRSGSLLEMSKEFDLYRSYLKIVKAMAKHKVMAPIFLRIPEQYVPKQTQSLQELLTTLQENANIFLNCMTKKKSQDEQTSSEVALLIIDSQLKMEECISRYLAGQSDSEEEIDDKQKQIIQKQAADELIKTILKKPLPDAYRNLLSDLRFDYIDMKLNGRYKHHYQSQITPNHTPSTAKIVRLAQEFADMSTSLPTEHTNAIFVRADKERVDVLKALVMGAKGTPYAHGAFLFDIYVDDNYPNGPPKMNLSTTGNGKVRFNPNLYSCGKVCLSLLGTWRGNASENWDPKLSTMLQVLVSTQAIIMSEEVYFNEPGFEQEAGTEEGEKKNEGYSNIVRYGNVKFAMIDQIRDPPKGFESIVRRHFYLKKAEIMEEVNKWIEYADTKDATYTGLINDHNGAWCNEFKKQKKAYHKKLVEAVAELEIELNKLQPPSAEDLEGSKVLRTHIKNQPKVKNIKEGMANLDEIDVSYGDLKQQEFSATDASVMDRWSRYIGAMGMDAVKKQANSSVFISGMGPLGIEISKNVVLSGVKQFTIHDEELCTANDLDGQFFLGQSDIGKNRAEQCLQKLQQLNSYVRVNCISDTFQNLHDQLKCYQLIIIAKKYSNKVLVDIDKFCRAHKIKLIICSVDGVFGRLMNDFGEEFIVEDKNGEQGQELMVKSISNEGIITLLAGTKHELEDNDVVLIDNVVGMETGSQSINKTLHKIKMISKQEIQIENLCQYSAHIRNGTIKQVKIPITMQFKAITPEFLQEPIFDQNMSQYDFIKLENTKILHSLYSGEKYETEDAKQQKLIDQFNQTNQLGEFPPLAAFLGGFAAQEAIKALTNKFMPVNQVLYWDCVEILPDIINPKIMSGLQRFVGEDLQQTIEKAKIFMVGCGAIGCELLKNFAMINLGIQGALTITDPDHIEVSNLNRQFLFREKHLRKPKSSTAAAAAIQMNPKLKNHIVARLDKVHEGTENIYTEQFFEEQDLIMNALDNVAARRYVDRRCVESKVALLESGTLGPKGHVQCIIPYVTESYGSSNDPVEEGDIPYCTLKMFPEEAFHCVEFARDKFSKLFSIRPKTIQKIIETPDYIPGNDENKILREAVKLLKNVPQNYDDCISWARRKFQKYFVNDIQQLMFTYPLDAKTKDGNLFWTMPKRPPVPLNYNIEDELHTRFISTLAYLRAKMFGLQVEENWRSEEQRLKIAKQSLQFEVPNWQPNEEKKKNIASQVNKNDKKQLQQEEEEQEQEQSMSTQEETNQIFKEFLQLKNNVKKLFADEFEKDNDSNGHIDYIHAFGNLRAANYKLEPMDWLTVKLKAGRIVPALATTTAVIAGLQTIEMIKTLKKVNVVDMKNAFVNLAIPYVQLTEPGGAPKQSLTDKITVTLWDRWEIKLNIKTTLGELFQQLYAKYQLFAKNMFLKSSPIYMEVMMKSKDQKQEILDKQVIKLLEIDRKIVDVTINFTQSAESMEIVKGVPIIRLLFQ